MSNLEKQIEEIRKEGLNQIESRITKLKEDTEIIEKYLPYPPKRINHFVKKLPKTIQYKEIGIKPFLELYEKTKNKVSFVTASNTFSYVRPEKHLLKSGDIKPEDITEKDFLISVTVNHGFNYSPSVGIEFYIETDQEEFLEISYKPVARNNISDYNQTDLGASVWQKSHNSTSWEEIKPNPLLSKYSSKTMKYWSNGNTVAHYTYLFNNLDSFKQFLNELNED